MVNEEGISANSRRQTVRSEKVSFEKLRMTRESRRKDGMLGSFLPNLSFGKLRIARSKL